MAQMQGMADYLHSRRQWLAALLAAALLTACSAGPWSAPTQAQARTTLAPTGVLRIGVYPGSPTSLVEKTSEPEMRGVTVDLGRELASRLGVPARIQVYPRVAEVLVALQKGEADFTVTNATQERSRVVDFASPLVQLELGVLVPEGSPVRAMDQIDGEGFLIGVTQGSSSERVLGARLQHAKLRTFPTLAAAADALRKGEVSAFATNKGILFELADQVPRSRVLEGSWGAEHLAPAIPKGREVALPYLDAFADSVARDGSVQRAADRAGLRGIAPAAPARDQGHVSLTWLGQSAFRIVSPKGKVIVTDPWLVTDPITPPEYKKLENFRHIDVLLVSHGHFDHIADAPALARMYNVPLRAPGDLNYTLMVLGVLPPELLPRMNKGGTIEPAPGIHVTAVHADHSSNFVWRNPATQKQETHDGGEPVGWIIELENGFRIYFAGDTAVFGDMKYIGERWHPDLALVPIGGNFTMDPQDAAWAVKEWIRPKAVIPMHYGVNPLAKGTAKEFVDAMGATPVKVIVPAPGQEVDF